MLFFRGKFKFMPLSHYNVCLILKKKKSSIVLQKIFVSLR